MRETLDEAIDRVAAAMTAGEHREIGEIREKLLRRFSFLPELPGLPVLYADLPVLLGAAASVLMAAVLLDRPRDLVVVALGEGGVLEAPIRAPRRDRDGHGGAGRQQLSEQPTLERLERDVALVAVEDEPGGPEQLVAVTVGEQ